MSKARKGKAKRPQAKIKVVAPSFPTPEAALQKLEPARLLTIQALDRQLRKVAEQNDHGSGQAYLDDRARDQMLHQAAGSAVVDYVMRLSGGSMRMKEAVTLSAEANPAWLRGPKFLRTTNKLKARDKKLGAINQRKADTTGATDARLAKRDAREEAAWEAFKATEGQGRSE